MEKTTGKEVAKIFMDAINIMSYTPQTEFAEYVTREHRTLQEDAFLTFMKCITIWADYYDTGYYDARNEYTCKTSKRIVELLEEY